MIIPVKVKLKVNETKPIPFLIGSDNIPLSISLSAPIQKINGDVYQGEYEVTPLANNTVVLETKNKTMLDDVTVLKIPRFSTSNEYGTTFYIAEV